MNAHEDRCARCDSPIVDPTTRVIHGDVAYCCANCAAAMEQWGAGSDPHAGHRDSDLLCAHCEAPIVDRATMEARGDQAFCCRNCLEAMSHARATANR